MPLGIELSAVLLITVIGAILRAAPVLQHPFPLGDGGFFVATVDSFRSVFPALPTTIPYNGLDIPAVYPPLSFWLAAGVATVTDQPTVNVLRLLPLVGAVSTVPAVYFAARGVSRSNGLAIAACTAYAVLPRSYDWVIAGGGLPRGLGYTFALLAIGFWSRGATGNDRWAWLAGVCTGLAATTHPQTALFGVAGLVLVSLASRGTFSMPNLLRLAAPAIALASLWLISILVNHGGDGLLSLFSAGHRWRSAEGIAALLDFGFGQTGYLAVAWFLAAAGLLLAVLQGRWLIVGLAVVPFLVGAGGGAFIAMGPAAICIGLFVTLLLRQRELGLSSLSRRGFTLAGATVIALVVATAIHSGAVQGPLTRTRFHSVTPDQLIAYRMVAEVTPPSTAFLVIDGENWGSSIAAEWFPELASRTSLNTPQGSEWLSTELFSRLANTSNRAHECLSKGASCVDRIVEELGLNQTFVVIPRGPVRAAGPADCCRALRLELTLSAQFELAFDLPGASVFRHLTTERQPLRP